MVNFVVNFVFFSELFRIISRIICYLFDKYFVVHSLFSSADTSANIISFEHDAYF